MNFLELKNYNLEKTLLGGQAFNWDKINGEYYGFIPDNILKIVPTENGVFYSSSFELESSYLTKYLNTSHDYSAIVDSINKDIHISNAIMHLGNVRLLKQDFNQTLLSFILTSHKNIKSVRKLVRDISKAYGKKVIWEGKEFYTFPTVEELKDISENELRSLGLGFRAKYFRDAVRFLSDNHNFGAKLELLNADNAKSELLRINGIGEKIADCIMVFSLGFYNVTPLDVWAKRVLIDFYGVQPNLKYSQMKEWYSNYFQENTAWAGQFLFEYIRDVYKIKL